MLFEVFLLNWCQRRLYESFQNAKITFFISVFLDWRTFTGFSACLDESSGPFEGNWVNLKSVQIIWTCFISRVEPKWNSNLNERLAISEENLFQLQINFVGCRKIVGDLARVLDITVIPWNIRISGFTVCRRLLLGFCYRKQIETLLIDEFPAPEKFKIVNFLSRNKTPASQAGDNLYAKRDEIQQSRDLARWIFQSAFINVYFMFLDQQS